MGLSAAARDLAEEQLSRALPRRWRHVQAVAAKAERLANVFRDVDADVLVASAWLHDVGYSPQVISTGLHALDGALWLRGRKCNERVAGLVAYHSCAEYEAQERGLVDVLQAEFSDEGSPVRDALWCADMTTGPDGQNLTVQERLSEVRTRYGPDHLVTRFWVKAEPVLMEAVNRTQERLAVAGFQPM
ncbi:HD domain-containing protein [Micromonospora sp. CA-248260]|uniref:HD domain-containing protein n=1 Tax=Micromonospora sp. CA-248260 TaxID=3239962 RepID=UPI003D904CA3